MKWKWNEKIDSNSLLNRIGNGKDMEASTLALILTVAIPTLLWLYEKYKKVSTDGKITLDEIIEEGKEILDKAKEVKEDVEEILEEEWMFPHIWSGWNGEATRFGQWPYGEVVHFCRLSLEQRHRVLLSLWVF